MTTESFGRWLKRRRSGLGLTQAELAERIGYSWETLQKIETDRLRPSKQLAAKLAEALELPSEHHAAFLRFARDEGELPDLPTQTSSVIPSPSAATVPLPASTAPSSGTVTLLFTDIEGSTPLWEQQPDAMALALAQHNTLLHHAIATHGGFVFKTVGDAFQAAFPTAHTALAAALAAQRALHLTPTATWGQIGPLRVRMGLHIGPAQWQTDEYAASHTFNRVQRVMSAGHGGQILLTAAVVEVARGYLPPDIELRDLGQHRLKGLSLPEHLYQVVAPDLPADFPPLKTLDTRLTNLPIPPTALIGREVETRQVASLLQREGVRLVTLTGPGGTGKTRLALEVAHGLTADPQPSALSPQPFPDGVYFVNLAPISDPALVASTIAQTLGVRESGGRPSLDLLKDYLRDKHILLALDNFEQVVEAAPLVAELLAHAPKLKVLVTSRETLHVRGEYDFAVPPLALPDPKRLPALERLTQYEAVRLFIERAQAAKADFAVTNANAPAVAEICHRLDGLPLAIELAAARIKALPPQALLARLEHRLKVLTSGARDLPTRQQTLRNTIAWSYDLLDEGEKTLFRRLGVFVGGCTLEAAEAVCNAEGDLSADVLDGLASLVDKSLLKQEEGPDGEPRFTMLETIREFALERLAEIGEEKAIRTTHAAYYLALAEAAEPQLMGPQAAAWLGRLETEHDNLRAALGWSKMEGVSPEVGLRLAGALWAFWDLTANASEGQAWLLSLLGLPEGVSAKAARAKALYGAGILTYVQGDWQQGRMLLEKSLALSKEVEDKRGIAKALGGLGTVAWVQGDARQAKAFVEESLRLRRELGNTLDIADALLNLGRIALSQEDPTAARPLLEESLSLYRQIETKTGTAHALEALGRVRYRHGDHDKAVTLLEESLTLFRALGNKHGSANALLSLGHIAQQQGNYSQAVTLLEESIALFHEEGNKNGTAWALYALAHAARRSGDYDRARALLVSSLVLWRELKHNGNIAWLFLHLADIINIQGDAGTAEALQREGLVLAQQLGENSLVAVCLIGLAGIAVQRGAVYQGTLLAGAGQQVIDSLGRPLDLEDRLLVDRTLVAIHVASSDSQFEAAWAEGRAMTLEEAVVYALEVESHQ